MTKVYLILFFAGPPVLILWLFRKVINWRHFCGLALFFFGIPAIIAFTRVFYSGLIPLAGCFYLLSDWVPKSRGW